MAGLFVILFGFLCVAFCMFFFKKVLLADD